MDRLTVVWCAYRDWVLDMFWRMPSLDGVKMKLISDPEMVTSENIAKHGADVLIFYGWSWMVPPEIVDSYLCLCVHPSPLPKYRGGSPIQNQIINGEIESAVSIFRMTHEVDAGDLCSQTPFELVGDLKMIFRRINDIVKLEVVDIVKKLLQGSLAFWPQEGEPTVYRRRRPEESLITETELLASSSKALYNKIRCLQDPYPNAYIECADGKKLYITEAHCEA